MSILDQIARQFANQLLTSRAPIAACDPIGVEEISDAATSRYYQLLGVARHAHELYYRQTAPPAIVEQVHRDFDGKVQPLRIARSAPRDEIDDVEAEILEMAIMIQAEVCAAAAASAEADAVVLHKLKPLTGK